MNHTIRVGTWSGLLSLLAVLILAAGCASPGGTAGEGGEDRGETAGEAKGSAVSRSDAGETDAGESGTETARGDAGDEAATGGPSAGTATGAEAGVAATATANASSETETETGRAVAVRTLPDGWALLPLIRTKVAEADRGKHLLEVFSRTPGPGWEIQLRPRKPSTSRRLNIWKEYEVVGKPPEGAAATDTDPAERKVALEEQFSDEIASVIIYGTDSQGEEVSLVEPVR